MNFKRPIVVRRITDEQLAILAELAKTSERSTEARIAFKNEVHTLLITLVLSYGRQLQFFPIEPPSSPFMRLANWLLSFRAKRLFNANRALAKKWLIEMPPFVDNVLTPKVRQAFHEFATAHCDSVSARHAALTRFHQSLRRVIEDWLPG